MMQWFKGICNGLLFYGGWVLCLIGAEKGDGVWMPFLTWTFIAVHLFLVARNSLSELKIETILIAFVCAIGMLLECGYLAGGMIVYATPNTMASWLPPLWIVTLYALVAICLNHSLAWMQSRLIIAAVLGAIGGAMSYKAGVKLGAAHFLIGDEYALLIIGAVWFFFFPGLLKMVSIINQKRKRGH